MKIINREKYQKYINELLKRPEKKLTLFCHQEGNNSVIIEGRDIKFQGTLLVYSRGDIQICFGQLGEKHFSYKSYKGESDHLYIIIDQNKVKRRFHINYKDHFITQSEKDDYEERAVILTYVENDKFAQLQVYDSFLKDNRFGEFFADTNSTIVSARCLALGQLVNTIPNVTEVLPDLYESKQEGES
jgi:hypothetical protein